jgi:N utilization substance protein A
MSRDRDVDPVGACVGIRGSRIQNIVQELRGERIDIVVWSPDVAQYAKNALSPAQISRITVDDDSRTLEVIVPDDQLTPSIGRKGQNVKLAAKLLGWKIDIYSDSRYNEQNADRQGLDQLASVAEMRVENFLDAGFGSLESVNEANDEDLMKIDGLTPEKLSDLRAAARFLSPVKAAEPEAADEAASESAGIAGSPESEGDGAGEGPDASKE